MKDEFLHVTDPDENNHLLAEFNKHYDELALEVNHLRAKNEKLENSVEAWRLIAILFIITTVIILLGLLLKTM